MKSVDRLIDFLGIKTKKGDERFSSGRRRIFKALAAFFPAAVIPAGMGGIAGSYSGIRVPVKRIPIANLPDRLEGLKIAHLSDPHLGIYVHLDDLKKAVELIAPHNPDLVLVTGDIADDLEILPEALRLIDRLKPKYGIFASVGNHEYYRGIDKVLRIFETAPFPMLINRAMEIDVEGIKVNLAGADDPVHLQRDNSEFLRKTIDASIGHVAPDSFKLLMCHRPEGFDHSVRLGIDLVLAGHTHGGQIGMGGRSIFESLLPEKYLWGTYRRDRTTLFTSAGMGHWLPFRLGCPAEAPILILEKG
jgi:predicted MPP superfamily phosphohydrolase